MNFKIDLEQQSIVKVVCFGSERTDPSRNSGSISSFGEIYLEISAAITCFLLTGRFVSRLKTGLFSGFEALLDLELDELKKKGDSSVSAWATVNC